MEAKPCVMPWNLIYKSHVINTWWGQVRPMIIFPQYFFEKCQMVLGGGSAFSMNHTQAFLYITVLKKHLV